MQKQLQKLALNFWDIKYNQTLIVALSNQLLDFSMCMHLINKVKENHFTTF